MLNKIFLLGRLGKDPEMKSLNSNGTHIASFPLAVQTSKKDADGKYGTMWVVCKAFDKTADNIQKFTKKGAQVLVEGELNIRKWTNEGGVVQYFTEIVVGKITFLSKANGEGEKSEAPAQSNTDYTADDIPF